jgi:carboxyl-terminal processing protease
MLRKKGLMIAFAVGMTVGLLFGPVLAQQDSDLARWRGDFFEPLSFAIRHIRMRYVDKVEPEKLLVGAYHGILSQLDDYSNYIPRKRLEEFQGDTQGEFGGLGIQIRFDPLNKLLKVEQPIPGTPAFRQGVLAGDIITKVEDEPTGKTYDTSKFESVHDAVRILRGEVGTKVTITVFHRESREQEKITIERATITVPGVRSAKIVDREWKIGYVYVANFHERTADDLRTAIKKLQEEGMQALVVDLRFNPGGLLTSAIDVSDMFLTDATVVSTRGRRSPEQVYRTRSKDLLVDAPIAVLVNGYSASASEIVAGAIKDNDRGLLVGATTFGKGSVQSILPLGEERGALKLTTAKYYTPSGVSIEKTGVKPHIEVTLSTEQNRQLARDIASENGYPPVRNKEDEEDGDQEKSGPPVPPEEEKEEERPLKDDQLNRAIDVLKAVLVERRTKNPKSADATR